MPRPQKRYVLKEMEEGSQTIQVLELEQDQGTKILLKVNPSKHNVPEGTVEPAMDCRRIYMKCSKLLSEQNCQKLFY